MNHPFITFFLALIFLSLSNVQGQVHKFPEHGGDAVPGTVQNSYLIGWGRIDGVVGYEYVVSDNPLCFVGCSGDTRQGFAADTVALEFNMEPNKWYYWITRIIMQEGDTSEWSLISSFFTKVPEDAPKLISVAPNPVIGQEIKLNIDWARDPESNEIDMKIYDINGYLLRRETYRKPVNALRFEEVTVQVPELPSGIYFLDAVTGNLNNRNNFFTLKVILHREL